MTFEGDYNVSRASAGRQGARVYFARQRAFPADGHGPGEQAGPDPDGRASDESPSFAPNGRIILYATDVDNRGVLAAVSSDGRFRQRLGIQAADVREPSWGPFLVTDGGDGLPLRPQSREHPGRSLLVCRALERRSS